MDRVAWRSTACSIVWKRGVKPPRAASADIVEQVGIGQGAVLRRLQRPDVERDRRTAARGYDPIDQELGGRHVAFLSGSRQYRLENRFDALRGERVEARPSGLGEREIIGLPPRSAMTLWPGGSVRLHIIVGHELEDTQISRTVEQNVSSEVTKVTGEKQWARKRFEWARYPRHWASAWDTEVR